MIDYFTLCKSVSDYHELIFGVPVQLVGENDDKIYEILGAIEKYVEVMTATFAGREVLRAKGWNIEENNEDLQALAEHYANLRQFEDDEVALKHIANN